MAVSEQERLKLFNCMAEAHGQEVATIIMESLPPVDWRNLATKDDISALNEGISALKEYVDSKFEAQSAVTEAQFITVQAQFREIQAQFRDFQAQFVTLEANLSKRLSKQSWFLSLVFGGFAGSVMTLVAAGAPFG